MVDINTISINEKWHPILGEEISLIEPYQYVKLSEALKPPKLSANEDKSVAAVLPYIRQKVKMWGIDVLRAENIKTLIEDKEQDSGSDSDDEDSPLLKNKLSRFDCIASLLASAECTVARDIFRTLSQFPIAFPLIIPELDESEKFKVMLPLLTGPVIKWETTPGTIIENHLFNDPFKMIVAVRIGTNPQGKSIILNQLMTSNSMFSSYSEPRAEYGIPHMIGGSVEFTWLTQETCKVSLWNDVFENYYKEGAKEIILLANLHGDALNYPDQIKFLNQFPSSFLVFLMPGHTEEQIDALKTLIGSKKVVYGYVNQKIKDKKKYVIDTNNLTLDKTLKKVRMMFKEALEVEFNVDTSKLELGESLQFIKGIETYESRVLIDFIEEKTCRHIKLNVFQLQRKQQLSDGLQILKDNDELQDLLHMYQTILKLSLDKRRRALAHLEREISRISMIESSEARHLAVLKKEELHKSSLVDKSKKNEKKIRNEIANIWAEVDSMSLGLEHFFRELGQIYKVFSVSDPNNDIVLKLPKFYSELLIGGHTVEILDGDTGTISEAWFSAICEHIRETYPKLRIFVISILGLQSSGKSTLLNALFACRFAVSVGRCTRGLFMRLLFLEKDLSDQLNIDAFILIDTEGLGAPEKMDDPESEKKDRILATFAMGISNLTILNVLGESMRDLTEILQIAIVTMARLEKAGIAPDIIMVQHISERNVSRLSEPEEKFRTALKDALNIAEEQDIEMGISNTDCLQILDKRLRKGQLLKQFRPFKNGATAYAPPSEQYHEDVVNLYNSIIEDCRNSKSKIKFSEWHSLIQNYWNAVSHEDFAVRFKNIKEIYEFIELGKRIAVLKETIDRSFQKHEEFIRQEIRSKLQDWSPNDKSDKVKNECLELIETGLNDVPDCNNVDCKECSETRKERIELEEYLKDKNNEKCEIETKQSIEKYIQHNYQSSGKKLVQILEANIVRKGVSSESLDIINKHLEEILKDMPNKYSEHERKQKVDEIWNSLRDYMSTKNSVISIAEQIDKDVEDVYPNGSTDFINQYKNELIPNLSECKAYKKFKLFSVEMKDIYDLQDRLNDLVDKILKERKHFYPGIIRDLKKEVTRIIGKKKYLPEFNRNVHLYSLLNFKPKMIGFQKKWDRENTPLGVLDQMKKEYLETIDIRLQHGRTVVSEGHIVGDNLLRVIHRTAMNAGNSERKRAVCDISWLSCAETIRLKYFERLAEQVQNGDNKEAIQYFSSPKRCIENWYKSVVDNNTSGNPEQKYEETYSAEFNRVLQEIRNCQSFEKIKKFVNDYMTQVDVSYKLDLEDLKDIKESDLKIFRETIEEKLTTRGNPRLEPFQKPSDDKTIMGRLGCTEACYWCGALCWGSRDHHESSITKTHHTSHQPGGLHCTFNTSTNELRAVPCHKVGGNWDMYYYGNEKPVKWSVAKDTDFKDWKFEPHYIYYFNDLMCWFFEKLHKDLAKKENKKPSPHKELKEYGCLNLDYHGIMSTFRTRIK